MANVTERELRQELEELRDHHPKLKDDELFVAWFLRSFLTEDDSEAVSALVGGSRDKSLDAIFIDNDSRRVFLVQGKFRQKLGEATEHRSDVIVFASLAEAFESDEAFARLMEDLAPDAAAKVKKARLRVANDGFSLQLYYVTLGKCSSALQKEARNTARPAAIDIIDGKRVLQLLSDYLDGVAPPIPQLDLEIEAGNGVTLGGVLKRFDSHTAIDSWVVPIRVREIATAYQQTGIRIFARNVRGYLGDTTPINRNMEVTLSKEPEHFWYYNNGITIVCDHAERLSQGGRDIMRMSNPQIINGQQTTRIIASTVKGDSCATVIVRVISVPRDDDASHVRFEKLVSKIVAATNWQNKILASDLMANDRRQIDLERKLRKLGYQYVRKRQTKGEARQAAGMKHQFLIKKDELAQTVAACDLDPSLLREGKERLFEERYYSQVFASGDPLYYLCRYWLAKQVSHAAMGYPERAYAKWLVTNFLWSHLRDLLTSKASRDFFRWEAERNAFPYLKRVCNSAFQAALAFYRDRRGKGETAIDVSGFFRLKGRHNEFESFWRGPKNTHRSKFNKVWAHFEEEFSRGLST